MSVSYNGRRLDEGGGQKAWSYCEKCAKRIRLEFHTRNGKLYQAPLSCGHKYNPEPVLPADVPVVDRGPGKQCLDCPKTIYGPRKQRCRKCNAARQKAKQTAWREANA